ncbi:MAG: molybdate ABC transporter permease subunit [Actinobacteria bacterium]|nr:molybdate ABC transporter permease subunit [Actinomycetota bacterium]
MRTAARLRRRVTWVVLGLWLACAVLAVFIAAPLAGLIARGVTQGDILDALSRPFVQATVRLSILTTVLTVAAAVVFGTPVAYVLARHRFPGYAALDTLMDVPVVLPPVVGGLALLLAYGRAGWLGGPLHAAGLDVAFTTGAVVLAQMFVAVPFYIRAAQAGFESVDRRFEAVSATLGAAPWRTFRRITAPLALPSLAGGAVMCWARALGEFGATLMFAGSLPGRTQTLPLAIMQSFEASVDDAIAIAILLVFVAFVVLLTFKVLARVGGRAL